MKKFIKIFALCLTLALMLSVSALAADLVVESVPAELKLSDAETLNLNIEGTYEADKLVSLEVKAADGTVVLSQQAICDETGAFVLSGIMSDDVEIGSYTAYIGAQGLAEAQSYPIEVVPNGTTITVDLVNAGQSYVTVSVNDAEAVACPNTEVYPAGTKLLLTAVCDETHEFLYWKDPASGKILKEKFYMEVYVGLNATYEAVFADITDESIYVTFKSNNQILATGAAGSFEVPANPYIAGYTFDGWFVNGIKFEGEDLLAVEETTTYVAGFLIADTEYAVTVDGEAYGSYKYNEKVTVTAEAEKEGQVFVKWTRDGEVVSYDLSYSFFVNADTELEAVYGEEEATKGVVIVMAQPTIVAETKLAFYAERNVPAEYKVLESGIILSQEAEFDLKTPGVLKAKATYTSNNAQFTVRKKDVYAGDTWYGKAYLIYQDTEGNTITVYSEPAVSGTGTAARP